MSLQRDRRRLSGGQHTDEKFIHLDLRNALADYGAFTRCSFYRCKIGKASFSGSVFKDCRFVQCDMGQIDLPGVFDGCVFSECDLDQANFGASIIKDCQFLTCRLEYARFSRATVTNTVFGSCQFHGAYLDMAETQNVDFRTCNLWGAVIPASCAFFAENQFDRRQLHMLLALVCESSSDQELLSPIRDITDERYLRVVNRLVRRETPSVDEQKPAVFDSRQG